MQSIYKSLLFSAIVFLGNLNSSAQIVKFIKNPLNVKYRVYITNNPKEATLFVFKVDRPEKAIANGLWYIVENPILFSNAMNLFQVNSIDEADLIVYYTKDRKKAGSIKKK
jgi:hypothetical protein